MSEFPRYAIYYAAPRDSALDRFGAELIGYDAWRGDELAVPAGVADTMPDWQALTSDPRKYGFHATLKAPFALAAGRSESELITVCGAFAGSARRIAAITPVVRAIGDFVALVPDEPSAALDTLAQDCVETFDGFRAPLTAEDRARRNPAALTPRQLAHLDRWGYPHVGDDFRFHMTLTGRIPLERRAAIVAMLRDRFAASAAGVPSTPLAIDRIALVRQDDASSRFKVIFHPVLQPQAATVS